MSGAVPVYLGASNVKEHVPNNSIIHVDDFENPEELGRYLKSLADDRAAYEKLHEWRSKPLPQWFVAKYNFTHTHSNCRVCRWANAKLNGLPWNHDRQQIEGKF